MIKDVLVNLAVDAERDFAGEFAISLAHAFNAHLSGVAFAYEPAIPGTFFGTATVDVLESRRERNQKNAEAVRAGFDATARRAGLSVESHVHNAGLAQGAEMFARLARRFDLSVVAQTEPNKLPGRELIIEAVLFDSGRPVLIVPYIQRERLKLDRV